MQEDGERKGGQSFNKNIDWCICLQNDAKRQEKMVVVWEGRGCQSFNKNIVIDAYIYKIMLNVKKKSQKIKGCYFKLGMGISDWDRESNIMPGPTQPLPM